jgi:hypothetical protein
MRTRPCWSRTSSTLIPTACPGRARGVRRDKPATVVVTTPNVEYNALFANLAAGRFRHRDHRFEWARAEFQTWAERIGGAYGYRAELSGIGQRDDARGMPTQMVFTRQ